MSQKINVPDPTTPTKTWKKSDEMEKALMKAEWHLREGMKFIDVARRHNRRLKQTVKQYECQLKLQKSREEEEQLDNMFSEDFDIL